jgi:hypothetical protein
MKYKLTLIAAAAALLSVFAYADTKPADLSGTWKLNVQKSDAGSQRAPQSVVVTVVHNEPAIKWTGEFVDAQGQSHPISVDGIIDGKPRPDKGANGGTLLLKRIDSRSIENDWTSDDGKSTEKSTLTISADGSTVTRKTSGATPDGNWTTTEVYEKQ